MVAAHKSFLPPFLSFLCFSIASKFPLFFCSLGCFFPLSFTVECNRFFSIPAWPYHLVELNLLFLPSPCLSFSAAISLRYCLDFSLLLPSSYMFLSTFTAISVCHHLATHSLYASPPTLLLSQVFSASCFVSSFLFHIFFPPYFFIMPTIFFFPSLSFYLHFNFQIPSFFPFTLTRTPFQLSFLLRPFSSFPFSSPSSSSFSSSSRPVCDCCISCSHCVARDIFPLCSEPVLVSCLSGLWYLFVLQREGKVTPLSSLKIEQQCLASVCPASFACWVVFDCVWLCV